MAKSQTGLSPLKITNREGAFIATDKDGNALSPSEYRLLILGLQTTVKALEEGISLEQHIMKFETLAIVDIVQSGKWMDGQTLKTYSFNPTKRAYPRPDDSPCVYFIKSSNMPDFIKIGMTENLYGRTHQLYHVLKSEIVTVAAIETPHHKRLEKLLHTFFADANSHGEWFWGHPVLGWLDSLKGIE